MIEQIHETGMVLFIVSIFIIGFTEKDSIPFWLKAIVVTVMVATLISTIVLAIVRIWT